MAHLKYYVTEKVHFPVAYERKMTVKEAEMVFDKLIRHFKIKPLRLEWTSGRNHAHANGSYLIRLNIDYNNFGILCHELAHILHYRTRKDNDENYHNKRHYRIMKRMINYCEKKNWFVEEMIRRNAPKPVKPAPTQEEIKMKELIRVERNIQKYEKKIKFYSKKLSKAKRSYNLRLTHLKRYHTAQAEDKL